MKTLKTIAFAAALFLSIASTSFAQLAVHRALELEISTETNKYYQIQTSPDMVTWMNYGNEIIGTGDPVFQLISTRGKAQEYYMFVSSNTNTQVMIDIPSYASLCGRRNYRRTEEGTGAITPWAVKVLGTATEQGQPVYLLQEYDENGFPNDQEFLHTDMSKGLFQTGGLNDYGQPTEENWHWEPYAPKLMKTFVPATEYTNFLTHTEMPGVVIKARIKTEAETISVPYGTLNCQKVTHTFSAPGLNYVEISWYAKHLGLVKRDQNGGDLWELISYEP